MRGMAERFMRREDGTITVFATVIFVLMVGVGGIALDLMRFEAQRAQLQYTLDRAILAAAALDQTAPAETVVRNYFETAGLENYRLRVTSQLEGNSRRVTAQAELDMNTLFMRLFGQRALSASAAGAAQDSAPNIEISMVLDISSSMSLHNRMTNLKPAARDFVSTILRANAGQAQQRASISIVPYHGLVNMGTTLSSVYALTNEHNYSRCARFEWSHYTTTSLNPFVPLQRLAHLDWAGDFTWHDPVIGELTCPRDNAAAILPWSNNEGQLHGLINSLEPVGMTSIDVGMRWGVALLDPSARPALNALAAHGHVHADFTNRPANLADPETVKVIILLTDGEITGQHDVNPAYRSGPSPFWRDPDNGHFSLFYAQWGLFWQEHAKVWSHLPDGGPNNNAVQLDYADLWNHVSVPVLEYHFFDFEACAGPGAWLCPSVMQMGWEYRFWNVTNVPVVPTEADLRLRQICNVARASGIVVFTIALEAPANGETLMRHCATTAAHYYDLQSDGIDDAFASIAGAIGQLRLVQ
jgi:Flp pilus assembly protein TadG